MPKITPDEVTTQQHRRIFRQPGGPLPSNPVTYAGQDAQYMILTGVSRPVRGGIDPIRVPDPKRRKAYKNVGRKVSAPDYPTATLTVLEKHGSLPFQLGDLFCAQNLYLPVGACEDPSDFLNGWSDFVEVVSHAEVTEAGEGDRMAWEDDNQAATDLSLTLEAKYAIGKLGFGPEAASEISREIIDVVYGSTVQCGDCGPVDDGTKKIYAVAKSSGAASPGLPAEVIYTLNGGATWTQVNIDGFGATEDPLAIDIVGNKLVVVGLDALYWATLNANTGAPGAFTKVSTGFVAAGSPNDIYVLSTREVFFCGDGGYIYKATDVTAGVTAINAGDTTTNDLLRIHGDGNETIVSAGRNSDVIVSHNRGATFATVTTEPSAIALNITALWVKSDKHWWVGTGSSGRVYYTERGGESAWTHMEFMGAGAGTVRDIVFATDEVGYF